MAASQDLLPEGKEEICREVIPSEGEGNSQLPRAMRRPFSAGHVALKTLMSCSPSLRNGGATYGFGNIFFQFLSSVNFF